MIRSFLELIVIALLSSWGRGPSKEVSLESNPSLIEKDKRKEKDSWDKAQSGFVSSVVIATVGLLINSSIQNAQIKSANRNAQAQIESSKENTKAQVAVAERNATAQIEQARQNAQLQEHIQEGTLTSQLVEHLVGDNSLKKRIAIVALQRSVPANMYQTIIGMLITSDSDADVRQTAYMLAGSIRSPTDTFKSAVTQASIDQRRPEVERTTALRTVSQIELNQNVPRGIYYLSSSSPHEVAALNSAFVPALIKGLNGAADAVGDGQITFDELQLYVRNQMALIAPNQHPMAVVDDWSTPQPIMRRGSTFNNMLVLVVANGHYNDQRLIEAPEIEAQAREFGDFIRANGGEVSYLLNAKANDFSEKIVEIGRKTTNDTLLIIYYAGLSPGEDLKDSGFYFPDGSKLSASQFMDPIRDIPAKMRIVLVGGCFAAGAPSSR